MRFVVSSGVVAVVAAVALACGSSGSTDSDAGGDGGCTEPTEGTSCSANDVACQPQGDICCIGYSWICQNGVWTKASVGCACQTGLGDGGPFACGPTTTCSSATQYCDDQPPGIALPDGGVPPDSYTCVALPAECASNPTCACVESHGACSPNTVASCDESAGQVTVHCLGQ